MKVKKNLISMLMLIMVVTVLLAGQASAAGEGNISPAIDSEQEVTKVAFSLTLAGGGSYASMGTTVEKVATGQAYYYASTITNNSGSPLYLNVNNAANSLQVGTDTTILSSITSGSFNVSYRSSTYNTTGVAYRAAARTAKLTTAGAYISGYWHP